MTAMADYVQERANTITTMPQYYVWFYQHWLPLRHPLTYQPPTGRGWPEDTYQADIALLAWLMAEMTHRGTP